jgi:hypothetical protein
MDDELVDRPGHGNAEAGDAAGGIEGAQFAGGDLQAVDAGAGGDRADGVAEVIDPRLRWPLKTQSAITPASVTPAMLGTEAEVPR